ncbi:MAG: hypothetical protein LBL35_00665 [Clostridiales bacterium]|nr:hypothetical protein [Clostridiales bacterium]
MIYLAVNGFSEAKLAINEFNMKRLADVDKFQVFKGENAFITVTGGGEIANAAAVSRLLTLFPVDVNDVLAWYYLIEGTEVELYNKASGRKDVYGDILFAHNFKEAYVQNDDAAAVFQTASIYMPPHAVFMMGINDAQGFRKAADWLLSVDSAKPTPHLDEDETRALENIRLGLKLSHYMNLELRKRALRKKARSENGVIGVLMTFASESVTGKNERRAAYEAVMKTLES